MQKKAIITGVTGQDGAYLAEFLLNKGYAVHGIKRRSSLFNTDRIDHLYQDPHEASQPFYLHHGDMTDSSSLVRIIQQVQPDEIYNLAAQSHVAVSFEEPEYTAKEDVDPILMGAISYRHTQMKLAGGHLKSIKLVVKGHDAAGEVLAHAVALKAISEGFGEPWPAGSGHETGIEDMEAKAEVWTDAEGFAAEIAKFQEAATALHTAAEGGDLAVIGDALGNVGQSCGDCHDVYRD